MTRILVTGMPGAGESAVLAELARHPAEAEPLRRRGATRIIDTRRPVGDVTGEVETLLRGAGTGQ